MRRDSIPDQTLFEPDPTLERAEPRRVMSVLKIFGAALCIALTLYLFGPYDFFFLHRTPDTAERTPLESALEGAVLIVPLRIFLLVGGPTFGSERNEDNVHRLVKNADAIWNQADMELTVEHIIVLESGDNQIRTFLQNPPGFARAWETYDADVLNVVLVQSLHGLNGVAFLNANIVVVADFTSASDFRTLAHELGHVFGLSHVNDQARLMASGGSGETLTLEEIINARMRALKFAK